MDNITVTFQGITQNVTNQSGGILPHTESMPAPPRVGEYIEYHDGTTYQVLAVYWRIYPDRPHQAEMIAKLG